MSGRGQTINITDSVELGEKEDEKTVKIELQAPPVQSRERPPIAPI